MLNKLLYALRIKKPPGFKVPRDVMLKAIPVRNAAIKWEVDKKGEVALVIPQKDKLWVKIVSRLFRIPPKKVIVLDEVGSYVWRLCDGKNDVAKIVDSLCKRYNLTRKEAEVSLLIFFRQLSKRGLLGFAVDRRLIEGRVKG